jgi:hypothetical protein
MRASDGNLDADRADEYLRGNVSCPDCGGWDVARDTAVEDGDGRRVRLSHVCDDCGGRWNEIYALHGLEGLDRAGQRGEAFMRRPPGVLIETRDGGVGYTAVGDVDVVLIDWDMVAGEWAPSPLRELIEEIAGLPDGCDRDGDCARALDERLATILAED